MNATTRGFMLGVAVGVVIHYAYVNAKNAPRVAA